MITLFSYDYAMDAPPDIQRIPDMPRHSTPYPDPPMLSARPGPALQPPRPRASSVPPTPNPAKRMALLYQPVTETVTPPISPARVHAVDRQMDPDTPSPIQKSGRSRGRGMWRASQKTAPVGTRSKTRQAELEKAEATLAQASHAEWPPRPDPTIEIQHMTHELRLRDIPLGKHLLQLRRQRWFHRTPCVPLLSVHHGEHLLLPVVVFLQSEHLFRRPVNIRCMAEAGEICAHLD